MANTYELITSTTLTGTATTVTFSSIPQTYTDLVVHMSTRDDGTGAVSNVNLDLNSTNSNKSYINNYWFGGSFAGYGPATDSAVGFATDSNPTNQQYTWAIQEVYIYNYTNSSYQKQYDASSVSTSRVTANIGHILTTNIKTENTNVSSIIIRSNVGGPFNFVSGCSFYLYGIKNS